MTPLTSTNITSQFAIEHPRHRTHPRSLRQGRDDDEGSGTTRPSPNGRRNTWAGRPLDLVTTKPRKEARRIYRRASLNPLPKSVYRSGSSNLAGAGRLSNRAFPNFNLFLRMDKIFRKAMLFDCMLLYIAQNVRKGVSRNFVGVRVACVRTFNRNRHAVPAFRFSGKLRRFSSAEATNSMPKMLRRMRTRQRNKTVPCYIACSRQHDRNATQEL